MTILLRVSLIVGAIIGASAFYRWSTNGGDAFFFRVCRFFAILSALTGVTGVVNSMLIPATGWSIGPRISPGGAPMFDLSTGFGLLVTGGLLFLFGLLLDFIAEAGDRGLAKLGRPPKHRWPVYLVLSMIAVSAAFG